MHACHGCKYCGSGEKPEAIVVQTTTVLGFFGFLTLYQHLQANQTSATSPVTTVYYQGVLAAPWSDVSLGLTRKDMASDRKQVIIHCMALISLGMTCVHGLCVLQF